ncbi:hypothetical protein P154DRAFT_336752 [Amniculicola lignicola CBS 123094]|uniref:Camp independent regulatory protein n=1 Tax=Amniculicola lignicola CBS 123094 TaxID=1392246 RepID=A0A6A5X1B9_9PLEO|nr:hypothetical protein P154DRAFT_336752 [Amniculicola lignicola CBS 123094]
MLQGIRASMPPFGHNPPFSGVQKVENYNDVDPWSWSAQATNSPQTFPNIFDPSPLYAPYSTQGQSASSIVHPRHHSIATSHMNPRASTNHMHAPASTPPPARHSVSGGLVKAQPAFKPTWHGFLDTTKDAMTIVEAALQGRLSHISRRPHDKERAEMLTSGTVLVYEENASGIKRWTDAVHWSPSRVMNNCLIYRQLIRALKPEEKKSALNPSCGSKRKRKESATPSITNTGESIPNADDEYENSAFDSGLANDISAPGGEPLAKVYANFAQNLNPDQQRRFCGSLIDSYEFKEGGLMKKTISVRYQNSHHHVISYYTLEDVVSGKLKRPFQDPKIAEIQPRPELLAGWKVCLEDEEGRELPLAHGYSQQLPSGQMQQPTMGVVPQGMPTQPSAQPQAPLRLQVQTDYWNGSQYTPAHHTPPQYARPQPPPSHYSSQQASQYYGTTQPSPQQYSHQPQTQSQQYASSPQSSQQAYPSLSSPQNQTPQQPAAHHYPQSASTQQYQPQAPSSHHYPEHISPIQQYPQHIASPYSVSQHPQSSQQPQFPVAQPVYDVALQVPQSQTPVSHPSQSPSSHHDPHRRASAPVALQTYDSVDPSPQYHPDLQNQGYYVPDAKFSASNSFSY